MFHPNEGPVRHGVDAAPCAGWDRGNCLGILEEVLVDFLGKFMGFGGGKIDGIWRKTIGNVYGILGK